MHVVYWPLPTPAVAQSSVQSVALGFRRALEAHRVSPVSDLELMVIAEVARGLPCQGVLSLLSTSCYCWCYVIRRPGHPSLRPQPDIHYAALLSPRDGPLEHVWYTIESDARSCSSWEHEPWSRLLLSS